MLYPRRMHDLLRKLQRELADGLSGLTAEQTQMRGAPEKWSIQQIVEHLILTWESTSTIVEGRIKKGTPTKASPSARQRLGQFLLLKLGIFPKGRLAPEIVLPPEPTLRPMSAIELNAHIAEVLLPLGALLNEAERTLGPKTRSVSHGLLGPMTPEQWRRFHFVHGEHHLRQILALRRTFHI